MISFVYPVLFLVTIFSFFFLRRNKIKTNLPCNFPIVGMLPTFMFNIHRLHDKISKVLEKNNGTIMIDGGWFSSVNMLITCDPENLQHILCKKFSNFPKGIKSKEISDVLGDSLFNQDFEPWKHCRRYIHTYLPHRNFRRFLGKILPEKLNLGLIPVLDHVSDQKLVVDLQDIFQRLFTDIAFMIGTGYNPESLSVTFPKSRFSCPMNDAFEAIFYRHILPEYAWKFSRLLGIGFEGKLSSAKKILFDDMEKYIARKREIISNENEEDFDLLKCFLLGNEVVGYETISDNITRDNIMGFIAATEDTTSSVLTWFSWLVSKNPLVEAKIRTEIEENFSGRYEEMLDPKELGKLVYLHATMCEALRLFPPVPFHYRIAMQDDILPSGHRVHPESRILLSAYAMGRMKAVWGEDCAEFKPERWIGEDGGLKFEGSQKFCVFSSGPRTCPGKELAFILAKSVAATLILNYDFQVLESQDVSPKAGVMLHTKNGLVARVQKRCN